MKTRLGEFADDRRQHLNAPGLAVVVLLGLLSTLSFVQAQPPVVSWVRNYNGPGDDEDRAEAIVVDAVGNAFVTGYSYAADNQIDYVTIACSSLGMALWTNRYVGPGNSDDRAAAMAVDSSGNVFVTGTSTGGTGGSHHVTLKYSGAGAPQWTNSSPGSARAMAVDSRGDSGGSEGIGWYAKPKDGVLE